MKKLDYSALPPQKAIPVMREQLYALLERQKQGCVHNSDGTRLPTQLFDVARMVEYLLVLLGQQQEEIVALKERLGA